MPTRKPIQKASVIHIACEHQTQAPSSAGKAVLDKIQKCLSRAYHPNASEAEAKTALFISQKLMSEHNVTQADLLANDDGNNKAQYGGKSVVRIEKVSGSSTKVINEAFVNTLASAICSFFDCKKFSTAGYAYIDWSFFGIANNTVAAAVAFEMTHNLILDWACAYKGGSPTFSYRLGVANGLKSMARLEKQKELQAARHEGKAVDKKDHSGSNVVVPESNEQPVKEEKYGERETSTKDYGTLDPTNDPITSMKTDSGNDSDDLLSDAEDLYPQADFSMNDLQTIDLCDNVDETIDNFIKEQTRSINLHEIPDSEAPPDVKADAESDSEPLQSLSNESRWKSEMQLVQFRANSEKVADDYLKENNIRLRNSRKRSSEVRDWGSYVQGHRDSSKINVRQRTLE